MAWQEHCLLSGSINSLITPCSAISRTLEQITSFGIIAGLALIPINPSILVCLKCIRGSICSSLIVGIVECHMKPTLNIRQVNSLAHLHVGPSSIVHSFVSSPSFMYLRKLASSRPWISQLGVDIPWADPEGRGVGQGSRPPWKITSSVRHSHPLGNTWTPILVKFRLSWNKQLLICRGQNLKKKNTYTQKNVRFFLSVGREPPPSCENVWIRPCIQRYQCI